MRYLITGGAGFIGAALANRLADDGHEVYVLDNLSNGDRTRLRPEVFFTRGDICDVPNLWSLLQDVDCVYHLAARVSVAESLLYPQAYNETNVGGAVCLMTAMRDAGVGRVVLASSGAVYGSHRDQPVSETDVATPDSPYAVSKLAAEQYVRVIGRTWGIETVALRIFNAYGPYQQLPVSHAPVIPRFLHTALGGGSVVIFGDGSQSRDFVYVSDVVNALVAASTADDIDQKVINIGSGQETTLNGLADAIEAVTRRSLNRLHNSSKTGGVQRLVADIDRAYALLGYQPQYSLLQGLRQTLASDPRFKPARSYA